MITTSNWRERMVEDMRLHGLRPRTVEGYALAVRLFLERTGKSPEEATEEDVRRYVLHLRDERMQAPSSISIAVCALRFFFVHTLGREYEVFDLMRVHKPRTLPSVLSREEVRRALSVVEHPVHGGVPARDGSGPRARARSRQPVDARPVAAISCRRWLT